MFLFRRFDQWESVIYRENSKQYESHHANGPDKLSQKIGSKLSSISLRSLVSLEGK